MKIEPIE